MGLPILGFLFFIKNQKTAMQKRLSALCNYVHRGKCYAFCDYVPYLSDFCCAFVVFIGEMPTERSYTRVLRTLCTHI